MSQNLSSSGPMRPLSVGNVVSAGLRLYSSHFETYFKLSVAAALWSFIPIYGWAKFTMLSGAIARLAFGQLINQPETVAMVKRQVGSKMWQFFLSSFLVGMILFGAGLLTYILLLVVGVLGFLALFGSVNNASQLDPGKLIIYGIVILVLLLLVLLFITWLASRLLIYELPIAVENQEFSQGISRSWELTSGSAIFWRIQLIYWVAALISLPFYLLIQIPIGFIQELILRPLLIDNLGLFFLSSYGLGFLAGIVLNIFLLPFWQSIKAVLYYDLRSRREGLDLQLRDRPL